MPFANLLNRACWLAILALCAISSSYADTEGLFQAVASDDYSAVRRLLAAGADINAKDMNGWTPLQSALEVSDMKMARFLLEHHAAYTIHQVAALGDVPRVKLLLRSDPKLVSSLDNNGFTPLHSAASTGQTAVVRLLLTAGANVGARDNDGRTPLHWAAGRPGVIVLLLDHGADVNAKDDEGETVLLSASEDGNVEIVELLIARGADVNARDNAGVTPLSAAESALNEECEECDTESVARLLRKHGAHK